MINKDSIRRLFEDVAQGRLTPEQAVDRARVQPFLSVGCGVTLDTHRELRTGQGETILGQGKDAEQVVAAVAGLAASGGPVLATRIDQVQAEALLRDFPQGAYWPRARLFALHTVLPTNGPWKDKGEVLMVCAGAADLPVALEAFGTAAFFGPGRRPDQRRGCGPGCTGCSRTWTPCSRPGCSSWPPGCAAASPGRGRCGSRPIARLSRSGFPAWTRQPPQPWPSRRLFPDLPSAAARFGHPRQMVPAGPERNRPRPDRCVGSAP